MARGPSNSCCSGGSASSLLGSFACAVDADTDAAAADDDGDDDETSSTTVNPTKLAASLVRKLEVNNKEKGGKLLTPGANALTLNQIIIKAGKKGLGGGLPGAIAGAVQVLTLMWMRTIINYQSRYGTTFQQAVASLMSDGGIPRFYRGLPFALVQAPLSRFVSVAANDGVEALLTAFTLTEKWGPGRSTIVASFVVGFWRMALMPIDTCKTVLQVDSSEGFRNLMRRVKAGKIGVLYQGAFANALSSFLSHYPWFYTYNFFSKSEAFELLVPSKLIRNAGIGIIASVVSDTIVNCIRVIKTTKQAVGSKHNISYASTVSMILAADGWKGLFGRGLQTRIMANAPIHRIYHYLEGTL
jgi:Mitochondrial carrier protein